MTSRLSKSLKKQLEASLSSLTPKQAGKLLLIYLQEAERKHVSLLEVVSLEYPPFRDLIAAQKQAVDQLGQPKQAIARYNGFLFLLRLGIEAQLESERLLHDLRLQAAVLAGQLLSLVQAAQVSDVASQITKHISRQPRPLSAEQYTRLLQSADNAVTFIEDVAYSAWEHSDVDPDPDYLELSREDCERLNTSRTMPYSEFEETRRAWLTEQDIDQLLAERFGGDPERLEDWLADGGRTNWKRLREAQEQVTAQFTERLTQALAAGQLEGWPAVGLEHCWDPVLVDSAGRIPAWAALREVWPGWLTDRGYQIYERPFPDFDDDDDRPGPVYVILTLEGKVAGPALAALAGAFVEECRKQPWGSGLNKTFDAAAVAVFLTTADSPLVTVGAPDLGAIDLAAFAQSLPDGPPYMGQAVSVRSLEAARASLGLPETMPVAEQVKQDIQERYYPSDNPGLTTDGSRLIADRLATLRQDYPTFLYGAKPYLTPVFNTEYATPLEMSVRQLGAVFGLLATFKHALNLLSAEFFDGFSVLLPGLQKQLEKVEVDLNKIAAGVDLQLLGLKGYPWLVDVDRLQLVKEPVDQETAVGLYLGNMLTNAWSKLYSRRDTVDLGDGKDFNAHDWLADQLTAMDFDPVGAPEARQQKSDRP